MLGESTRRMKSGVRAASGGAMMVVAAVVAELDVVVVVVVRKEREGWKMAAARLKRTKTSDASCCGQGFFYSYREDVHPDGLAASLDAPGRRSRRPRRCARAF